MKKLKSIFYFCSVVFPLYDILKGSITGLRKGLRFYGNKRLSDIDRQKVIMIKEVLK